MPTLPTSVNAATGSDTRTARSRQARVAAIAVLVGVACLDAAILSSTRDRLLGVHEDHFDKGVALHDTGRLSSGSSPMVFRPPGYPVFVAATLTAGDAALGVARAVLGIERPQAGPLVMALAAQAALLGALAAAVFWFAQARSGMAIAAACAVAVGCHPLLIILAGHVSYELLHLVVVTVGTLRLLQRVGAGGAAMFANGLVWGVATLIKSVTLVAPACIALWAWGHYGARRAVIASAAFAIGLCVVVAPYTVRNYALTDRFIPVNEQATFALWATSLERIPPGENYLRWVDTFVRAISTYNEVTGANGASEYSAAAFEEHVLVLSDRFGAMARQNLRRDPTVYAYNALHNAVMFIADTPSSYYFTRYAWPHRPNVSRVVAGFSLTLMTVIAIVATVGGCVRRDPRWTLLLALFVMMWAAHALTFLEARYLYIKLPTIIVGFVLACATAGADGDARWRRAAVSAASAAVVLSIAGLLVL